MIQESTLDNWMPYYVLEDADGKVKDEGHAPRLRFGLRPSDFLWIQHVERVDGRSLRRESIPEP